MPHKSILRATLLALLTLTFYPATAEKKKYSQTFDSFTVHYNALPTNFLSSAIATRHKIRRSRDRILVNIAVKHMDNNKSVPISAKVTVRAHNRTGQLKYTEMRAVKDGKGIYYIGEFRVANREHLFFTVTVTPTHKQAATYSLKFNKTFTTR